MLRVSPGLRWFLGLAFVLAVSAVVWMKRPPPPRTAAVPVPERPEAPILDAEGASSVPPTQADAGAVDERVTVGLATTSLRLRLLVEPGSRPFGPGFVDVTLDGVDSMLSVTADGRTEVPQPITESPLVVRADGYHDAEFASAELRDRSEVDVVLRPRHGLFGRVVDVDGRPVPGVAVSLMEDTFELRSASISGDSARANLRLRSRPLAFDLTDGQGWYALDVRTDRASQSLQLRAYLDVDRAAEREVVLPPQDHPLEDLVLTPLARVEVRVVDEGGAPIAGVGFWPNLPRRVPGDSGGSEVWATGADGTCRVPVYRFPDALFPYELACVPVGRRIDGVDVGPRVELERPDQRLEWICRVVESVRLFVRDAVTGKNVVQPRLTLAAFAGTERVANLSWINAASSGAYIYGFHEVGKEAEPLPRAPAYDRLVLDVDEQGYEPVEDCVLTRAQLPPGGEYTLLLQPRGPFQELTGRVVDEAGAPLAGVTVRATGVGAAPQTPGADRGQGSDVSDSKGKFRISWATQTPGLSVLVYCSDRGSGQFARVGPLDPAAAQDLELRVGKPLLVPFVLDSDLSDDAIVVRVTLLDLSEPLPIVAAEVRTQRSVDGTRRGLLRLPAAERVSISAYPLAEAGRAGARREEIEFDPRAPSVPLRLSVPRSSVRLRGRVVASDPATVRDCKVVAVSRAGPSSSEDSPVFGVREGDRFQCDIPSPGAWSLLLVEPAGSEGSAVVGRLDLDVVADRDDVVLSEGDL